MGTSVRVTMSHTKMLSLQRCCMQMRLFASSLAIDLPPPQERNAPHSTLRIILLSEVFAVANTMCKLPYDQEKKNPQWLNINQCFGFKQKCLAAVLTARWTPTVTH